VTTALNHYLDSIRNNLRLDPSSETEVISELETHIKDRLEELEEAGLSEEEAARRCMKFLGSTKLLARQIYEAHSQGTWRQALLASTPHLLFASLFALNWWQSIGWLLVALVLVFGIATYGWCHGKPTWLFPWLGYALLPVVASGLLLLYLPKGWSWLAIIFYIPLALWLLYRIIAHSIKRDWLYTTLMVFPMPTLIGWLLVVQPEGEFPAYSVQSIHDITPWVGLSFLAFAVAVAIFIRLRQRWLKVAVLLIAGSLTLTLVALYSWGRLGLPSLLVLVAIMLGLFLAPALLEHRIRHSQ
jgi:hypothetical protein